MACQLFISYSTADTTITEQSRDCLEAAGYLLLDGAAPKNSHCNKVDL